MRIRNRAYSVLVAFVLVLSAASEAAPLRVCMVSGSAEYESDISLARYQDYLRDRYEIDCTLIKARGFEDLPGLEALENCDVALIFTRRLTISGEQLERVKRYCLGGKPIVAVRTASHGFQNWLEFDKLVLGGNYHDHYGVGLTTATVVAPGAAGHPVLDGVGRIKSTASLYKTVPLTADAELLLSGSTPASETQPAAWSRNYKGARIFYTSLGAQGDFEDAAFRRLLANALFWAAERKPQPKVQTPPPVRTRPAGMVGLKLRSRVETPRGSGVWNETSFSRDLPVSEMAILICDMWDRHWCAGAMGRCDSLAGVMAPVIDAARKAGIQIIHAPSECMDFYADRPQRQRALMVELVTPPEPLERPDPKLPIDDSDGGCDTPEKPWYEAWTRQNARIGIGEYDLISADGRRIYSFLRREGITNVLFMGVHTNMCVLNRTFGMKQMTRWGINCVLVRDLTDTMYDPKDPPHVSHDRGTELVVEHIEKYWGPSITSRQLLAGLP